MSDDVKTGDCIACDNINVPTYAFDFGLLSESAEPTLCETCIHRAYLKLLAARGQSCPGINVVWGHGDNRMTHCAGCTFED